MKYGFLSLIALFFACIIYAQNIDAIITEAETFEKNLKETEALNAYISVLKIEPANLKALWKASELTGRIGNRLKKDKQKTTYFITAKTYAGEALKQGHDDADANYVVAGAAMRLAGITNGKEKAAYLRDMKNYADSALLINPIHARGLYTVGKWNYEIYGLNVAEIAAVKVLFGGMPKASLEMAIQYFEKVRGVDPWLIVNYLDLATAYIKNHRTDKAIEVLKIMVKRPPRTQDDEMLKSEGRVLLTSLQ